MAVNKMIYNLFLLWIITEYNQVYTCTTNTVQYANRGGSVVLQFQAVTVNPRYATVLVHNYVDKPNGMPLVSVLYVNGSIAKPNLDCWGCTFVGDTSTGNISMRLDNLQVANEGTYKHGTSSEAVKCITVYILDAVKTVKLTPPTNSIMEGVESLFTCETSACRPAANVSWFKESVNGQSHEITDVIPWTEEAHGGLAKSISFLEYIPSRNDTGAKLYCTALNILERPPVKSDKFTLNVQYSPDGPPKIHGYADGNTYKIFKSTQGELSCSIKGGNPLAILTWDCFNNGSSPLSVNSTVTRTVTWTASPGQDRPCTCHASHPVVGDQSVSVIVQVLYKASITSFVVEGYTEPHVSVTVNESDNLRFICSVDSNPASSIEIQFEGNTLQRQDNTNSLAYTFNATCLDAGIYRCSSENQYNYGNLSLMELTLYVRCSPRPLRKSRREFPSSLNVPVLMRFTALAYPEPGRNGFVWHKENGSTWVQLLSNTDLLISSSELQTDLIIKNMSKTDYGHYRVTVTNEIGKYEQHMFLTVEDINKDTSVNITLNVGITLGMLCAVLFVYAIIATVLLVRKSKFKETQRGQQTTFVNRIFIPDDFASAGRGYTQNNTEPTNEGYEEPIHQYTALERHTNDDRMLYDLIQQT
ncbi:uncharacterized protein LOC123535998 [Mercenaria mercenaria]|uniref:uncharacterized protein LOC123535998 n=1 Tax=Mercenaria mercenaria TaxID=6596 RepID=UPI00234EFC02|nr:uncharacterized protein LOC123535998 [Mercenaria mercenaria]